MPQLNLQAHPIIALQAVTPLTAAAARQLVLASNSKLYYATKATITAFNTGTYFGTIYGSDATGLTWTQQQSKDIDDEPSSAAGADAEFAVCSAGAKIYFVTYNRQTNPTFNLLVWTYDTAANTLTVGAATGVDAKQATQPITASVLNNGNLLITYARVIIAGSQFTLNTVIYNPTTDTWGTPTAQFTYGPNGLGASPLAQIHDPASDRTAVYFNPGSQNATPDKSVQVMVLDNTMTLLNTPAAIFTWPVVFRFFPIYGQPAVTKDSPSGGTSAVMPFLASGLLHAAFVDFTTFATALETIDDQTDLPPGDGIQVYSQQDQPGWAALDFGGTLYVVFTVDNGDLNNASSQSFLYAKNRTGGVWGGLQVLFTSVLSREMLAPFPAAWNANGPAILVQLWDPTQDISGGAATTVTESWILLPAAVLPTKFEISLFGSKRYQKPVDAECSEAPPEKHVKWFDVCP